MTRPDTTRAFQTATFSQHLTSQVSGHWKMGSHPPLSCFRCRIIRERGSNSRLSEVRRVLWGASNPNYVLLEAKESFASPDVLYVWDPNSKTKAQIKKLKTCGPLFLSGQQKLQKKYWSVSQLFRRKIRTKRRGVILVSPVIVVVRYRYTFQQ